jgi:L-ribulose-5-phosphate 4-epimerase
VNKSNAARRDGLDSPPPHGYAARVPSRRFDVLREAVLAGNRALAARGLAPFTFGNASGIDRAAGAVCIKPSGMSYDEMTAEDLVVVGLDGRVMEGTRRPSSDVPTHLVLYNAFPEIGGIAHAHSHFATAWAQAGREIPCLGTTHADYFHGAIPVVAHLAPHEVESEYEANTGHAIVRRLGGQDPSRMPAVLVAGHAAFCWGSSVAAAVDTMTVLEEVARLAFHTVLLDAAAEQIPDGLRDKHFNRKHGPGAYYGQPKS